MENNKVLADTFKWLFIGLLICFGVSYFSTMSNDIIYAVYGSFNGMGYIIFLIAEVIIAIALSAFIKKMNPIIAKILYLLYTALTGLSMSGIFIVYTGSSIAYVFLATSIIFGIFALIGKTTNIDLSKWSIYLFVALIAIIILQIINIFLANNTLNMLLCIISILVFSGYVAYDIRIALDKSYFIDNANKGIYCAFQLFIDFINIFLDLLRLFGKHND